MKGSRATDAQLAEAIGFRILARRSELGLTQLGLADRCSVTRASISHYETGYVVPGADSLLALCRALGVEPNQILGWEEFDNGNCDDDARLIAAAPEMFRLLRAVKEAQDQASDQMRDELLDAADLEIQALLRSIEGGAS